MLISLMKKKHKLKEYQRNYRRSRKVTKKMFLYFFSIYKIRKELVFKIKNNNYTKDKYYFQKNKNPININEVNIDKIVLSNKTPNG